MGGSYNVWSQRMFEKQLYNNPRIWKNFSLQATLSYLVSRRHRGVAPSSKDRQLEHRGTRGEAREGGKEINHELNIGCITKSGRWPATAVVFVNLAHFMDGIFRGQGLNTVTKNCSH